MSHLTCDLSQPEKKITLLQNEQFGSTGCGVFKRGGTKLEKKLPKNQHTQMKLLNFENWGSGELSKIGHYLRKKVI